MCCFVTGCKSTTLISGDGEQVQFFRFPPDQRTLLKWKKSLGLPSDLAILETARPTFRLWCEGGIIAN